VAVLDCVACKGAGWPPARAGQEFALRAKIAPVPRRIWATSATASIQEIWLAQLYGVERELQESTWAGAIGWADFFSSEWCLDLLYRKGAAGPARLVQEFALV
jgi:hypothetical protein